MTTLPVVQALLTSEPELAMSVQEPWLSRAPVVPPMAAEPVLAVAAEAPRYLERGPEQVLELPQEAPEAEPLPEAAEPELEQAAERQVVQEPEQGQAPLRAAAPVPVVLLALLLSEWGSATELLAQQKLRQERRRTKKAPGLKSAPKVPCLSSSTHPPQQSPTGFSVIRSLRSLPILLVVKVTGFRHRSYNFPPHMLREVNYNYTSFFKFCKQYLLTLTEVNAHV